MGQIRCEYVDTAGLRRKDIDTTVVRRRHDSGRGCIERHGPDQTEPQQIDHGDGFLAPLLQ